MFLPTLVACFSSGPDLGFLDRPAPARAPRPPTVAIPLAPLSATSLQLPAGNRPGSAPATAEIPLHGAVSRARSAPTRFGGRVYRVPMPVHRSLLPNRSGAHGIGGAPPPGFEVQLGKETLLFDRVYKEPHTWGFDEDWLYITVGEDDPAPTVADLTVTFPGAARAEAAHNLVTSGQVPADFVRRSVTVDRTAHRGLYLPAPARAVYRVTVPERGVLSTSPLLVPSSYAHDEPSDGAELVVSVRGEAGIEELARQRISLGESPRVRVDLTRFAGQTVDLILATDPGRHPHYDYVLLEDPVVYTPTSDPQRVVLVFIDTLRPDHLGFMGYDRPTSPVLDRWAQHAAVFEQARTVAPWTLPSALAALSGAQPEHWATTEPLAERLAAAGWRTEALVTNAFLSPAFDTDRGWSRFTYEHLLPAADIVDRAEESLRTWSDRDQLLLLHFMEPHIPYDEPYAFQGLFAGSAPDGLDFPLARARVNRWGPGEDGFEEVRDYLVARYDQNIRAVDHALGELLEAAGDDATVVLFSDHGEAFWEHGEFEHGHSLHEELLRVALAVRSPGMPAARVDAPVSLLDLTPTVLDLVGQPPADPLAGRSLVPLASGEPAVVDAFRQRPHGFGRPLYGAAGWGVQHGAQKWWDHDGYRFLFDLASDPGEQDNLVVLREPPPMGPLADKLAEALGRPVREVWRIDLQSAHPSSVTVTVSHPDGLDKAWLAYDPRGRTTRPDPVVEDGRVTLVVPPMDDQIRALYVVPRGDVLKPEGLALSFVGRQMHDGARVTAPRPLEGGARREIFLRAGNPKFSALVDRVWVPEPAGTEVRGYSAEVEAQLRELGYME